jgi:hypothetical protein
VHILVFIIEGLYEEDTEILSKVQSCRCKTSPGTTQLLEVSSRVIVAFSLMTRSSQPLLAEDSRGMKHDSARREATVPMISTMP